VAVAIPPTEVGGTTCDLGVYYNISKASLGSPDSTWKESDLKAATVVNGQVPPQAKEFPDFYFVFQPTQTPCSSKPEAMQTEASLRDALWIAVSTATLTPAS
jgi:hypothetical protein